MTKSGGKIPNSECMGGSAPGEEAQLEAVLITRAGRHDIVEVTASLYSKQPLARLCCHRRRRYSDATLAAAIRGLDARSGPPGKQLPRLVVEQ